MERLDGVLARVTYLPGVIPPDGAPGHDGPAHDSAQTPLRGRASSRSASLLDAAADAEGLAPAGAARNVAITALARRGLSRREVERHLRDRDFEDAEIEAEVARLEREGYLDDVALAQNLVGTLQERKGLGRSAIAAELARRLLAPAAIEYALELVDSSDELSRARELARKRASQLRHLDHDTAVRRLSGYLARRGYGGSTIRAAVEQALPQNPRRGVAFS
jgi:Uncharacterized protein conserved in bacteria